MTNPETPSTSAVVEYDEIESNIATLRSEFAGRVFDLTTTAGDKLAREVRGKFVKLRTRLEAMRTELKAPVLTRGRALDAEAARITKELLALEKPIDEQIKADERRRAEEAAEKARLERERKAVLQKRISEIRDLPRASIGKSPQHIQNNIDYVEDVKIGEDFAEFVDDAMAARATTLEALRALHAQAVQAEVTAKALEQARAEADAVRKAQAAREAQEAEERRQKAAQEAEARRQEAIRAAAEASFDAPSTMHPDAVRRTSAEIDRLDTASQEAAASQRQAARPVFSAPVSAPAPAARPASPSAWADQAQRPSAPPAAVTRPAAAPAPGFPRSLIDLPQPERVNLELVSVPKVLIANLIRASEVGDADQDEEWNEILNDFRALIGVSPVAFV